MTENSVTIKTRGDAEKAGSKKVPSKRKVATTNAMQVEVVKLLNDPTITHEWVQANLPKITDEWVQANLPGWKHYGLEELVTMMTKIKSWDEWIGSPWEVAFDALLKSSSGPRHINHAPEGTFPANLYKRAINRSSVNELYMFGNITEAKTHLLEWLVENWGTTSEPSIAESLMFDILSYGPLLSDEEVETLWRLSMKPNQSSVCPFSYVCDWFLDSYETPFTLLKEFLADPHIPGFSWHLFTMLAKDKKYHALVESFGGFETLVLKVNNEWGADNAIFSESLSNTIRATAALSFYDPLCLELANIDLRHELVLLLKRDAEKAGLDLDLPATFLAETLWESGSPGVLYINS